MDDITFLSWAAGYGMGQTCREHGNVSGIDVSLEFVVLLLKKFS